MTTWKSADPVGFSKYSVSVNGEIKTCISVIKAKNYLYCKEGMVRCSHTISDLLGGSPRRCKRESQPGTEFCWQHATSGATSGAKSPSPKTSPKRVKTPPKKGTPKKKHAPKAEKKVRFAEKVQVRTISPRNKKIKGGIAWAQPVTDLQAECVSSVMDVYGIWDREDLEKAKGLNSTDKRLITTCLRIMEGDMPSSPYRREMQAFSENREQKRDVYRRLTIARESRK